MYILNGSLYFAFVDEGHLILSIAVIKHISLGPISVILFKISFLF